MPFVARKRKQTGRNEDENSNSDHGNDKLRVAEQDECHLFSSVHALPKEQCTG